MRFGAVEAAEFHAAAVNDLYAAFTGDRLKAGLHRVHPQRLLLLHHFFHQLRHQAFGKLPFRQLGNNGFANALAFGFFLCRRDCRLWRGFIALLDGDAQQLRDFAGFRGDDAGAQHNRYFLFASRVGRTNIVSCDKFLHLPLPPFG